MKFITEDLNSKHTSITTINSPYLIWNYLQKILQNARHRSLGWEI